MAKKKDENKKPWKEMTPDEQLADLDERIENAKKRLENTKNSLKSLENKKNKLLLDRIEQKAKDNNQTLNDLM